MTATLPINEISEQRFDALAGYTRGPSLVPIQELAWYETQDERLLGLIVRDLQDGDFMPMVLGRDADGRFRWVDGGPICESLDSARRHIGRALREQAALPDEAFHQGDERGQKLDLFAPTNSRQPRSESFNILNEARRYQPAHGLIAAMTPYFTDVDHNFVEQFQTTGFDSRLWELYNFALLHELGFSFDRSRAAPDYHCRLGPFEMFVEAVTVQASDAAHAVQPPDTMETYLREYMPIKFGSALVSKLNKQYWKLPHVARKPLVFSIQDFHRIGSMAWTHSALGTYLYGFKHDWWVDDDGHLIIEPGKLSEHRVGTKNIPSNFFGLPGAEHVSAVLANANGTLPMFNRIGYIAGFGPRDIPMVRISNVYVHDPDASKTQTVSMRVDDPDYSETWAEGAALYHNPNALHPLDPEMFPTLAHHTIRDDGQMESMMPPYFPYSSNTVFFEEGDFSADAPE